MSTREYMARRLREFRDACKLNVNEVGERVGKSGKTISAWEVGRGQPDADMLVELCKVYGVRISDFYDSGDGLTEGEGELLDSFRSLNGEGQRIVLAVVRAIAKDEDYKEEK